MNLVGGEGVEPSWPCDRPAELRDASFKNGGRGGGRTLMALRPQDFESCASTNSATRPPFLKEYQFRHSPTRFTSRRTC